MITETGRVVAVETDSLWVETIQKSACNSCVAEKGCGQSLLAKWGEHTAYLRVLLDGRNSASYHVNDQVQVGIPEDVVVRGSLVVYLVPLILLMLGAWLGDYWWGSEVASISVGVMGLVLGGCLVRLQAFFKRDNTRLQPVLIDNESVVQFSS